MKITSKDIPIGRLDHQGNKIPDSSKSISAERGSAWEDKHKLRGGEHITTKRRRKKREEEHGWY